MSKNLLKNKVSVVTGGAGGIGKAISQELARSGSTVAILGRDADKGARAVRDIQEQGGQAVFFPADLAEASNIEAAANYVVQELGGADILVNNAALSGYKGPVVDTPREDVIRTLNVNLISAFQLSQLFLPHMIGQSYGRIINISSVSYRHNLPNTATYNMSKAGLNSLTQTLSNEVACHGITVNSIAPGLVMTDRIRNSRVPGIAAKQGISEEEVLKKFVAETPSGRFTTPDEVAGLVVFFTSSAADNITGEIVNIAGGY
jgi:NAD(P)-dependent dehydrogenase (short-subunit alcohol dehydrogenase family)